MLCGGKQSRVSYKYCKQGDTRHVHKCTLRYVATVTNTYCKSYT